MDFNDLLAEQAPLEDVVEFLRDRVSDEVIIRRLAPLMRMHYEELLEEWDWLSDLVNLNEL